MTEANEAVRRLLALLEDEDPEVRLRVAREVLRRVEG